MQISEIFDAAASFIALAAAIGLVLLLPLYFSQRRDVLRLRAWMERDPDHPAADIAASDAILDRAEAELEELLPPEPETGETVAATRVTHERPALERITMERAALAPHRRWRRFTGSATRTKVLVAVAIVALLVGVGAILASEQLLKDDGGGGGPAPIDRPQVTVAVLNGTSVNGLAGLVGTDVRASGYDLGTVSSTSPGAEKTVVLYANGEKRAARKVAKDLQVNEVKPIGAESRRLAGDADVVVIAGLDRAES